MKEKNVLLAGGLVLLLIFIYIIINNAGNGSSEQSGSNQNFSPTPTPANKFILPDLLITPPEQVYIQSGGENKRLRFSTSFVNLGEADLQLYNETDEEEQQTVAKQIVLTVEGEEQHETIGRFTFHPEHEHWHIEDFARYQLWSASGGQEGKLVAELDKVSFCLFDLEPFEPQPENASFQKKFEGCKADIQGLSVGWTDTYYADTEGQSLEINDLPDGRYRLRTFINPEQRILESDYENNQAEVLIQVSGDDVQVLEESSQASVTNYNSRITKKPFGIYITPENSPVQPERFTGFHTGVDFEFEDIASEVPVYAIADGEIVLSRWVSGYGGTVVLKTNWRGNEVYVLYGHLDPASIVGFGQVKKSQQIGILGQGYSRETDNARKHLHFAMNLTGAYIKGYVVDENDLQNWLDPQAYPELGELIFNGQSY